MLSGAGCWSTPYHRLVQSDPQNDRWPQPDSRDGAPLGPDVEPAPMPPSGPGPEVPGQGQADPAGPPPSSMPPPPRMPGPAEPAIPPSGSLPPSGQVPGSAPEGVSWPQPRSQAAPIESGGAGTLPEGAQSTAQAAPQAGAPADELGARSGPPLEAQDAGPAVSVVGATAVAAVAQGDWLASICPYLVSEDGTYRSALPDEGHRCTAQYPPARCRWPSRNASA